MKQPIFRTLLTFVAVLSAAAFMGATAYATGETAIMINDKESGVINMNPNRSDESVAVSSFQEPVVEELPDLEEEVVADISGYVQEVVRLVNEERTTRGLKPLTDHTALKKIAQVRAEELVTAYAHTRPDGRKCFTVYADNNVTLKPTAENIAWGQRLPKTVVDEWMASTEGHKEQILNPDAVYIGVGVYRDEHNVLYWTQLFAQ